MSRPSIRRAIHASFGGLALALLAGAALAQTAPSPGAPPGPPTVPERIVPPREPPQVPLPPRSGPGGRSDSVIPPPPGIDPEIHVPAPDPTPNTTPVIPPPGTPGGDPRVRPR